MAVSKTGFLFAALFLAVNQGWKGLEGYGLDLKPATIFHLLTGVFAGLLFFGLSFFLSVNFGFEKILSVSSSVTIARQLPMILLMTAIPSLAEDFLTRGYFFGHLHKHLKPLLWIMLSSLVFVLNHIWRLNDGPAVLSYLLMPGMVLACAVWIVKSLWLAFGMHWGANIAFESISSFVKTIPQEEGGTSSTWILAGVWALLLLILCSAEFLKKRTRTRNQPG